MSTPALVRVNMRYLRFQLQITARTAGGYDVLALTPRGQGRSHFDLPFTAPGSVPPASPEEFGESLFQALFQGEVLRLYERSLDLLAEDPQAGLRIELTFDPRGPNLSSIQALPWELMRQPGTPEFLALSRRRPVTRFLAVPRPVYAAQPPSVLRILAVASNPRHSGLAELDLAHEVANLREAVGTVAEVVTLMGATLAGLRQVLLERECHVLHFMGHGGWAPGERETVLFFEDEKGGAHPVRGQDLMNKLADVATLRLAVLNACDSAGAGFEPLAGVANALVLGGLPAVIAMQRPVSDGAAIAFSGALYERLAAGDPVDAAVAEGRQAVHSADPDGEEWSTPVLFLRSSTGELFPERDVWDGRGRWHRWGRWLAAALVVLLVLGGVGMLARSLWVSRLVNEGADLLAHRKPAEARERFEAALRLAPGSPEVLANLAGTEEALGDLRLAEEHYREAARRRPSSAEHLYNLGHFLNGRENYDEAYRILQKALAADPKRVDIRVELARAMAGRGLLDRARTVLKEARDLDREHPMPYLRLGELEIADGKPGAALPYLQEAHRRVPSVSPGAMETVWLLAKAQDQLGNADAACRWLRRFQVLDYDRITPWAPEAEETAARLGCPMEIEE